MAQCPATSNERNLNWFRRTANEVPSDKLTYDESRNWEMIYCQVVLSKCKFVEMCEGDFLDSVKVFVEQGIVDREEIVRGYNIALKEKNLEITDFITSKLNEIPPILFQPR